MNWLLLSFLASVGGVIVVASALILFLRHRLNRRHRVHPKVPTPAPITWIADPRAAARLHRRLVKVGHTAGGVADDHRVAKRKLRKPVEQPQMVTLAEELRQQAVHLDQQLFRTAQLPRSVRYAHLVALTAPVSEAEHACVRLVSVSTQVQTRSTLATTDDGGITDLAGQVQRLSEAHRLLQQIDAEAGLAPQTMPASVSQSAR